VETSEYCRACHDLEDTDQTECEDCECRCPELWEENKEAWKLWCAVKTQWRLGITGMNGMMSPLPIGLDYPSVYTVARTLDMDMTPALLHKLQTLEDFEIERFKEGNDHGGE
jgi:hypothetical protein